MSAMIPLSEDTDSSQTKYVVIRELIDTIYARKNKHYENYKYLRTTQTWCNVLSSVLHTSTVSSLFVAISTMNPVIPIVGASISSANMLLAAVLQGFRLESKLNKYFVSQSQYDELARDINAKLAKNNLSGEEILTLIHEINMRIDLIQDSSLE
jgi:hypothetical protein